MMQDYELDAWLGPVELTGEQRATLVREIAEIEAAYPDPDDQDVRDAAMSAAVRYIVGDVTPSRVGQDLAAATGALHRARATVRTTARLMVGSGMSESAAAEALGVNRLTVRSALGK